MTVLCLLDSNNVSTTFQRLIHHLTSDKPGLEAYLDDFIVHSHSWEEQKLFGRPRQANSTVSLTKSDITKAYVTFLGQVVGQGTVNLLIPRLRPVNSFLLPKIRMSSDSFRWLVITTVSVNNISDIAALLTNLLKKGHNFHYFRGRQHKIQEESFFQIRTRLWYLKSPTSTCGAAKRSLILQLYSV